MILLIRNTSTTNSVRYNPVEVECASNCTMMISIAKADNNQPVLSTIVVFGFFKTTR
jgi:hypothetical protein